jgi:hypothetical protein
MRGFIEAFRACDIERFLDAAIALTGSDPTVCANQVVGTLIQIKQECRWSCSLSAGAGGRALARRIAPRASGRSAV